jgi:O-antigen ligase
LSELTTSTEIDRNRPTRFGSLVVIVLCAMFILAVAAYGAVDTWAIALLAFGSMIVAWLWMADAWRLRSFNYSSNLILFTILGLILLGIIQLLPFGSADVSGLLPAASRTLTMDQQATKFALIKLVIYLIFFAAALTFLVTKKRYRRVVFTIIIFGTGMAIFAIIQRLLNPENIYGMRHTVQASTFGPYVNGHHFAGFMEMTLGLTLALIPGKSVRREIKLLLVAAAIFMATAIMMTGSRGGVLSFIGVLGFVFVFTFFGRRDENGKRPSTRSNLLILAGGAAAVLLVLAIGLLLGGELAMRGIGLSGGGGTDPANGRLHFWYVAMQIFRDNFLIGTGFESFGVAFTKYDTWNGAFRIENAHNDYFQMLADGGIAAFLLIVAFIYLLFSQGLKTLSIAKDRFQRNAAIGALAGCFGVLIHSFLDFPLRTPANMLVFLTIAALALVTINEETRSRR